MYLTTRQQIDAVCRLAQTASRVAVDTETTGLDWKTCNAVGMSIAFRGTGSLGTFKDGEGYFFKMPRPTESRALASLLASPVDKVFHNAKFDRHFLKNAGLAVGGKIYDTYIMAKLYDENLRTDEGKKGKEDYKLKSLAVRFIDKGAADLRDELADWMERNNVGWDSIAKVPEQLLADYGANDPKITLQLDAFFWAALEERGQLLLLEQERQVQDLAWQMERAGVRVDVTFLSKYLKTLTAEMEKLRPTMYEHAGMEFNPNSEDSLLKAMQACGWEPGDDPARTAEGDLKLDKRVLAGWHHPLATDVLDFKRLSTEANTFVGGLLKRAHNGLVHTNFNTARAVTGRWSSSDPNLQNQRKPDKMDDAEVNLAKKMQGRKAFRPRSGYVFVCCDLSQIEPRVMAWLSKSNRLISAMRDGWDYHQFNASLAFGVPYDAVTKEQRSKAKALGLALSYRSGAAKVAGMMGVDMGTAKRILAAYFEAMPEIKKWQKATDDAIKNTAMAAARQAGTLTTSVKGWLYKGEPLGYKFVPKHGGAKSLKLGESPASFLWTDKWNDPDYWAFEAFEKIEELGHIVNPYGRIRRLPIAKAYQAGNFMCQSTAGEILKVGMNDAAAELGADCFRLQIHDEVVCEFKTTEWKRKAVVLREALVRAANIRFAPVPIKADLAVCTKNWAEEKEVDL